jgi:N-acyl-D-aspartate/D-glutamate deacylase
VDGYVATYVSGVPVFENGAHTGALPGRLVRAGACAG